MHVFNIFTSRFFHILIESSSSRFHTGFMHISMYAGFMSDSCRIQLISVLPFIHRDDQPGQGSKKRVIQQPQAPPTQGVLLKGKELQFRFDDKSFRSPLRRNLRRHCEREGISVPSWLDDTGLPVDEMARRCRRMTRGIIQHQLSREMMGQQVASLDKAQPHPQKQCQQQTWGCCTQGQKHHHQPQQQNLHLPTPISGMETSDPRKTMNEPALIPRSTEYSNVAENA